MFDDINVVGLSIGVLVFFFFFVAAANWTAEEYLKDEIVHLVTKADTHFRDSDFLRRLAYRTIRLRIRQSPAGFYIEGNVLHFPFWTYLKHCETNDEAREVVSLLLVFADRWLVLDKQRKIIGRYKT